MRGLTSEEVSDRKARGLANNADVRTSRTYTDIFVKNAFTPFNIVLFILGILLVICDEVISAISATGIIIVNLLISTVQEMRAKRKLDRISLLVRPKVTVIRDGSEIEIDQSEIVMDDLIVIRAGEQALVDGVAESCTSVEMDESCSPVNPAPSGSTTGTRSTRARSASPARCTTPSRRWGTRPTPPRC